MNDLKKLTLVAATIAGLAVIGSLMNSQQSTVRAQGGGPTVTIDKAQLPLPVQGSLGISGTVAATQSGAWSVGIAGTPNVNVTNTATAPALTLDISKSASQHVELQCANFFAVGVSCTADNQNTYVVPAGQNLVVTSVDLTAVVPSGTFVSLTILKKSTALSWAAPNDDFTHSFQYPAGTVLPAGFRFDSSAVQLLRATAVLEGYLTPM